MRRLEIHDDALVARAYVDLLDAAPRAPGAIAAVRNDASGR
jgi:hypothetical protein